MTNNIEDKDKSVKDNVLSAIHAGRVTMRPKWQFALKAALIIIGAVVAVLALLYITSFAIFVMRQTGLWYVPGFGLRGFGVFLTSIPWLLLLAAVVFLIILEALVKNYSFAYKKPLLISAASIIVFVAAGSFIVAGTSFHRGLFDSAKENHLPVAGMLYREYGTRHQDNVAEGLITDIKDSGYLIRSRRDDVIEVIIDDGTQFTTSRDLIGQDDIIVVFGEHQDGNQIHAFAIREVGDRVVPFAPPPMFRPPPPFGF